jgi:hypothetical protein
VSLLKFTAEQIEVLAISLPKTSSAQSPNLENINHLATSILLLRSRHCEQLVEKLRMFGAGVAREVRRENGHQAHGR